MGVNVDALAGCLFQQHFEVVQVVSGDDDEGALITCRGDRCRNGVAVSAGVGGVEQRHAREVDVAEFENQAEPLFDAVVVAERLQAFAEPSGDLGVGLAEHASVVGVGRHAAQPEEQGRAERDDVRVAVEKVVRIKRGHRRILRDGALQAVAHGGEGRAVKVDVRHAHEERVHEKRLALGTDGRVVGGARQRDQGGGDLILQTGNFGLLAADAAAGAAGASRRLFALETEHVLM